MESRFIKKPNFPEQDIALAAISSTYPFVADALKKRGIDLIFVEENTSLPRPVASHADLVCFHAGGKRTFVLKNAVDVIQNFRSHGFEVIPVETPEKPEYPFDVKLNAAYMGKYVICHTSYLEKRLFDFLVNSSVKPIHVRQGYAKCSVVLVNESTIITSDPGIAQACKANHLEVLKIVPGHILLKGYSYGFLGGCCGFLGKNVLGFTGSLSYHPDGELIQEFLFQHGVKIVELYNGPLLDIGGILPLKEYQAV